MKPVTTIRATPAPERLHFWKRREGPAGDELIKPSQWAVLDDGSVVTYNAAGIDRAKMEALLSAGAFHWEYLGQGVINTQEGSSL